MPHNQIPQIPPEHYGNMPWYLSVIGIVIGGGKKAINGFERKIPWKVIATAAAAGLLFLANHGMQTTLTTIQTHSVQLAPLMAMPEQVKEMKELAKGLQVEFKDYRDKKSEKDSEQDKCLAKIEEGQKHLRELLIPHVKKNNKGRNGAGEMGME